MDIEFQQKSKTLEQKISASLKLINVIAEDRRFRVRNFSNKVPNFKSLRSFIQNEKENLAKVISSNQEKKNIFVSARYRTGSTYLYSLLSTLNNTSSFLEPLHPQLIDIANKDDNWHKHHASLASHSLPGKYFQEYSNLDQSLLQRYHSTKFTYQDLFLSSEDQNASLKRYINFFLSTSNNTNILQFNRTDFRLSWLKRNFPDALIINLRRSSRACYFSYLIFYSRIHQIEIENEETLRQIENKIGGYYHLSDYIRLLGQWLIPESFIYKIDNYEKLYLIDSLSNLWADNFADFIIPYETLIESPHSFMRNLCSVFPGDISFDEGALLPARKSTASFLQKYFDETWFHQREERCNEILSHILDGKQRDEILYPNMKGLLEKQLACYQGEISRFRKETEDIEKNTQGSEERSNNSQFLMTQRGQSSHEIDRLLEQSKRQLAILDGVSKPCLIIDSVFFQLYQTGIARVWRSLLETWAETHFARHLIVLDRNKKAPRVPGIQYRDIPPYSYENIDVDRQMLEAVCQAEGADLFISTYYSTPLDTPSVFMAYDMIPEVMNWETNNPMWREKHRAIQQASTYLAISQNTAQDLVKFFPQIKPDQIQVAHCGVSAAFQPATPAEIAIFKTKYGITKPYFMIVGAGGGVESYKNAKLFFEAFATLPTKTGFEVLCTGPSTIHDVFREATCGTQLHTLKLSDEELRIAYSGAVATVYPSKYEGFGLPIVEAMACGCPVITSPNASIPEVAGNAALYVNDSDVGAMAAALCEIQKPATRQSLISVGLAQAKKFSWESMAVLVQRTLITATLPFELRETNVLVFPNWNLDEEQCGESLQTIIRELCQLPNAQQVLLLIASDGIEDENIDMLLQGIAMNLALTEEIDVGDGPAIAITGQLAPIQWATLIERVNGRILIEEENTAYLDAVGADALPCYAVDQLDS